MQGLIPSFQLCLTNTTIKIKIYLLTALEHVLLAWLCLGTSFADSSQNIKPWSDLRIFTNIDQELELSMNDAATIEHLLVEDVVSDGGLLAVLPGGKLLLQNHQKKM